MGVTGFKYKMFLVRHDKLEVELNKYGEKGWRLHSCDAVINQINDEEDVPYVHFSVVMDKMLQEGDTEEERPTAIAMKG